VLSQNYIAGSSVRVVKAVFATIALNTAITTNTLEPAMQFWLSTGCGSLMMVYVNRNILEQLL
jgi:hypothetical protein